MVSPVNGIQRECVLMSPCALQKRVVAVTELIRPLNKADSQHKKGQEVTLFAITGTDLAACEGANSYTAFCYTYGPLLDGFEGDNTSA